MIINGNLRDGKRLYNIKALTVGEFEEYRKIVGENKSMEALQYIVSKTVFRNIELVIFGKKVFSFKKYDFNINKIPIAMMDAFQEDLFNMVLGKSFMMKARGVMEQGKVSVENIISSQ